MTSKEFQDILDRVGKLDRDEQLRLIEELASLVRRQSLGEARPRRITELRGLGKEIWRRIDTKAYIEDERNSWNG